MEKIFTKKKTILLCLIIVFALLQFTTITQKTVAIISTSIYVKVKYSERDFRYQYVEYVPGFGDYFVTYKDKEGENISFTVTPKYFPVYVLYDPLDRPM